MAEIDDLRARVAKLEEFAHAERWRATAALLLVRSLASVMRDKGIFDQQEVAAVYGGALDDARMGNNTVRGAERVIADLRASVFEGPWEPGNWTREAD